MTWQQLGRVRVTVGITAEVSAPHALQHTVPKWQAVTSVRMRSRHEQCTCLVNVRSSVRALALNHHDERPIC